MTLPIHSSAATHVGRRENNEDNFLHEPGLRLFAVADGMGGHEGGEVASAIAVQRLREAVCEAGTDATAEAVLGSAMERTQAAVCAARRGRLKHMGSTLSALLLRPDHAAIGHVGDSRIYRLRRGELELLTRDHSLAEELRRQGLTVGEENMMSHVITRALGPRSDQFGFGVMLVELLTGRRPFDGDTPEHTLERIRACAAPLLPDVDEDLGAIILRCLERDPELRHASAEELRRHLSEARARRAAVGPADLANWVRSALRGGARGSTEAPPPTRPLTKTE